MVFASSSSSCTQLLCAGSGVRAWGWGLLGRGLTGKRWRRKRACMRMCLHGCKRAAGRRVGADSAKGVKQRESARGASQLARGTWRDLLLLLSPHLLELFGLAVAGRELFEPRGRRALFLLLRGESASAAVSQVRADCRSIDSCCEELHADIPEALTSTTSMLLVSGR